MANLFSNLAVPLADGVGASVDVSAMGKVKSVTYQGDIFGSVEVQFSLDGVVFVPLQTFSGPARQSFDVAARFMRSRVSNFRSGTAANMDVGSNDNGALFLSLPVAAGNGVGGSIDVSALGTFNTIVVSGTFTGNVIIEISEDGTDWIQSFSFGQGGGSSSRNIVARFMRTRRENIVPTAPGTPVVSVGAINDPGSPASILDRFAVPEIWSQNNVAASQTAVALNAQVSQLFNDIKAVRGGSILGMSTRFTESITAGTATLIVTVNGTPGTLTLAHTSGSNPLGGTVTQADGIDTFVAGDLIGIDITTDAGFLPVSTDVEAWLDMRAN